MTAQNLGIYGIPGFKQKMKDRLNDEMHWGLVGGSGMKGYVMIPKLRRVLRHVSAT